VYQDLDQCHLLLSFLATHLYKFSSQELVLHLLIRGWKIIHNRSVSCDSQSMMSKEIQNHSNLN
jgi:hypothetical protein